MNLVAILVAAFFSGLIGYFFGAAKIFREEKQKIYVDILPIILKVAYDRQASDEKDFNNALSKLWLYGNKKVTRKMENALSILHKPTRGNFTKAAQEAIVEMRKDIQISPFQKIEPKDVNHIYTKLSR
jgi:hypothetical protein